VVPRRSALARVEGSQNLVTVRGRFGGETAFFGSGAGGDPTAVAVVSDILSVARAGGAPEPDAPAAPLCEVSAAFAAPHYVRFTVCDRPGIIAALADSFSRHGINIDAVIQQPGWSKARLPFVVTLESCLESRIDAALADIGRLDFHVQPPVALPILAAVAQGSDPPSDGRASSA
jgi:homoserine dehydrogenase